MKNINSYLIFSGNCRQAMEFYNDCLGGMLYVSTYAEAPGVTDLPQEYKDWIIHARITIKNLVLMASDTRPGMPVKQGDNFFISIQCEDIAEAEKLFHALSKNAQIDMPLQETFFAVRFGMLTDQFGVKWMINLEKLQDVS
jgi:PhnB protein